MSGFVEGIDRSQSTFFPPMLDDYVGEDNPVRAVDGFVVGLDLGKLGFGRVTPLEQGRPGYDPATLLKIYIYGYLNRVPSSRRLEREWPAPGSADTELGVLMEPEVDHGETEVYAGVQA